MLGGVATSARRIAELAACGLTNLRIAQDLFVTPKTVETHLTNVFRKLRVGSRRDLPAALSGPASAA
jgi:DNA-binding NarL/FixJ family response regulator